MFYSDDFVSVESTVSMKNRSTKELSRCSSDATSRSPQNSLLTDKVITCDIIMITIIARNLISVSFVLGIDVAAWNACEYRQYSFKQRELFVFKFIASIIIATREINDLNGFLALKEDD